MPYTTSCNTQSSAPEDVRDYRLKHVQLIGIINKLLLLHLVWCLYYLYQWRTVKQTQTCDPISTTGTSHLKVINAIRGFICKYENLKRKLYNCLEVAFEYITDTCDPINTTGMSHLKNIISKRLLLLVLPGTYNPSVPEIQTYWPTPNNVNKGDMYLHYLRRRPWIHARASYVELLSNNNWMSAQRKLLGEVPKGRPISCVQITKTRSKIYTTTGDWIALLQFKSSGKVKANLRLYTKWRCIGNEGIVPRILKLGTKR